MTAGTAAALPPTVRACRYPSKADRTEVTVQIPDFEVVDQAGQPWRLGDHLDAAAALIFLRGDW